MDSVFHSDLPSMHGNHIRERKKKERREKERRDINWGKQTPMKLTLLIKLTKMGKWGKYSVYLINANTILPPFSLLFFTLYRTPDFALSL